MSQTSPGVTVRMLPNRIAKRSALKPRARLMSTTARAKPPDRKTASAASPWSAPRARSRSIPTAPASTTTSAPTTGEIQHEAERHPGQGHVGASVRAQREPARAEADADRGADERVQDQQLGLGHERAGDEHPMLLAGGERPDPRGRVVGHAHLAQDLVDALTSRGAQATEEPEGGQEAGGHHLAHRHRQRGIERRLLGHVAQAPPLAEGAPRVAEEADPPARP